VSPYIGMFAMVSWSYLIKLPPSCLQNRRVEGECLQLYEIVL
jgi:hypothetical protein